MHSCFDLTVKFSVNNCFASIEILNVSNYHNWKQDLKFSLGISDLDLALREDKLVISSKSTPEKKKELLAKWERSNRLKLIAIKRTVSKDLLSGQPKKAIVKEFLNALGKKYQVFDNVEFRCLMKQLTNMRHDNVRV